LALSLEHAVKVNAQRATITTARTSDVNFFITIDSFLIKSYIHYTEYLYKSQ